MPPGLPPPPARGPLGEAAALCCETTGPQSPARVPGSLVTEGRPAVLVPCRGPGPAWGLLRQSGLSPRARPRLQPSEDGHIHPGGLCRPPPPSRESQVPHPGLQAPVCFLFPPFLVGPAAVKLGASGTSTPLLRVASCGALKLSPVSSGNAVMNETLGAWGVAGWCVRLAEATRTGDRRGGGTSVCGFHLSTDTMSPSASE